MDKTTMNFLMEHGYVKVSDVKDVLKKGKVKNVHIEVTTAEPFMLLAKAREENATIKYDTIDEKFPERLIISDRLRTKLFNVPLDNIQDMIVQIDSNMIDIVFSLLTDNNSYRIILKK